ncbi:hypothetical protein BGZ94_001478, partial [Podila epigama]
MNLSAILNDPPPGAALPPTTHSRQVSGSRSANPTHDISHLPSSAINDYQDHAPSNNNNSNNHHVHTKRIDPSHYIQETHHGRPESRARKHASSVSVPQLEEFAVFSSGNGYPASKLAPGPGTRPGPGPGHRSAGVDHRMSSKPWSEDSHPSESGKGKIRPNESNGTYSTSTFRTAPRTFFVSTATPTSTPISTPSSATGHRPSSPRSPSSSSSLPVRSSSSFPVTTSVTASVTASVTSTLAIPGIATASSSAATSPQTSTVSAAVSPTATTTATTTKVTPSTASPANKKKSRQHLHQ